MPLKKKLIFITRPIAPPWDEGSKNFALHLAEKIRLPNLIPHILTTKTTTKGLPKNVVKIPLFFSSRLTFTTKLRLFFFLIKTNADIVHFLFVATPITGIVLRFLLFFKRIKTVQTVSSVEGNSGFLLKLMIYGNRIVCLSKITAEKLGRAGLRNICIIPPGVDTERFKPSYKKSKIAFLGELYRMDSYSIISKLIPLLSYAFPDYSITLGFRFSNKLSQELELREKLHKEIAGLKNIEWENVIENMEDFLKDTKLVILPARVMWGKFDYPLVLLEALSCASLVLVSPVGSLSELTQYKGVLSPVENTADSFIEKVKEILSEKSYNNLSRLARESALKHFSIEKVAKQYEEIYGELIKS